MISRDFISQEFAAGVRAAVLSDVTIGPLIGKYWHVRQITIFDSDANGQIFNLYLVDPSAINTLQSGIQNGAVVIPDFPGQTQPGPLQGCHKLAPGSGLPGANDWFAEAQRGGGGSLPNKTSYTEIIIPPGWALYAVETNGVVSGLARFMMIRIAYDEIPTGCSPYKDGPWWG